MICQVPQQHTAFRTFSQENQTLDMIIGPYHKECEPLEEMLTQLDTTKNEVEG